MRFQFNGRPIVGASISRRCGCTRRHAASSAHAGGIRDCRQRTGEKRRRCRNLRPARCN